MKYYENGSLRSYMISNDIKTFEEPVIKRLAEHIANAFSVLSKFNILHQAIKPENILVDIDNAQHSPKDMNFVLTDIGLSRHVDKSQLASTMCGAPLYVAPEVVLSDTYDNRSDLWSLGVLLHRCYRGTYPFNVNNFTRFVRTRNMARFDILP